MKIGIQRIAKSIILEELSEQSHPEKVEDVIFWALKYYAEKHPNPTWGRTIAGAIVQRIEDEETKHLALNN